MIFYPFKTLAVETCGCFKSQLRFKDELMPRNATLIYYGYWFSPERRMLQEMVDASLARLTNNDPQSLPWVSARGELITLSP